METKIEFEGQVSQDIFIYGERRLQEILYSTSFGLYFLWNARKINFFAWWSINSHYKQILPIICDNFLKKKFVVFEIAQSYHSGNGIVIEFKSFNKGIVSGADGIPLKLTGLSTDTVDQYLTNIFINDNIFCYLFWLYAKEHIVRPIYKKI